MNEKTHTHTDLYGQIVVKWFDLVEVQLTATPARGQSFPFQVTQNDYINKPEVFVYGIETYTATELSTSPSGNTVIAAADVPNIVVNLIDRNGQKEKDRNIPLTRFRPSLYNGYTQYFEPISVDMSRSNISLVAAGTLALNQVVCFGFYYKIINR